MKFQIHRARLHVRNVRGAQRRSPHNVNVTLAAVKILDGLRVLVQAAGRENVAGVHGQAVRAELALGMLEVVDRLQAAMDFLRIKKFIAGEGDRADLVLPSFINVKANHHFVGRRVIELHVLDFKIKITATVVKFGEQVAIVLELVLLEHAAARQP